MKTLYDLVKNAKNKIFLFARKSPLLRKVACQPYLIKWIKYILRFEQKNYGYSSYRTNQLLEREHIYKASQKSGLLSFLTSVWNTDVEYLKELTESVFAQRGGVNFEWIILDNGSDSESTVSYLSQLSSKPQVKFFRVENNLGIIGGMRYCLERATGQYVLPLDSDDYLTMDCVNIITWFLQDFNYPPLLFTDEDKLISGEFVYPYFKPDWDPVLFFHSCYIAHLCVIDRKTALALGCYTDAEVEGSHDWDTFTRFYLAGHNPIHIPEVVYSWRMHSNSTASNINSKSYIHSSQKAVLAKFINAQPNPSLYEVIPSPFFNGTPDWWIRRKHSSKLPFITLQIVDDVSIIDSQYDISESKRDWHVKVISSQISLAGLHSVLKDIEYSDAVVHLHWDKIKLKNHGSWQLDVLTMMELFPDTVIVGGRVYNSKGEVLSAGQFFGFGGGCDTPDKGRHFKDPGFFAQMWKQHSVSAVSSQNLVVNKSFFLAFLDEFRLRSFSLYYLGAWLGAYARELNKRVVYSPFMEGVTDEDWDNKVKKEEYAMFLNLNRKLIPDSRLLSKHLGLSLSTAYTPVATKEREKYLQNFMNDRS